MTSRHLVAGVALVLVLVAIVAGLLIVGSPAGERARRLDERRIGALQSLSSMVDRYWMTRGRLPSSLAELANDPRMNTDTKDPQTQREYGYRVVTDRKYELCANFDRETDDDLVPPFWKHGAGRRCFEIETESPGK